jgi:phage I-like protein
METMSANNAQPYNNNNMENTKVKTMAAPTDDKGGKSDSERVLFALLAKFMGEHPEFMEQLIKKENTEQGGLSQWSAKVDTISHEIKTFKAELNEKQIDNERQALILQATKEGKVISLSANAIKKLGVDDLKEYVSKLETIVPMKSKLKILSANPEGKPSKEKAVAAFEKMLSK